MHRKWTRIPALLIGLSAPLGCGSGDGLERARVSGEVRVDGEPLENGSINFFPAGTAEGPSAGAPINKGHYDIPQETGPVVGKNRVELRGVKKTGRMVPNHMAPGTMREELVEALGSEFNTESEVVREIKSGSNEINFPDLKSTDPVPVKYGTEKGKTKKAQ